MSEIKIGAIVEIRTAAGLAYAQYTNHHPSYGEVVRILPGLHEQRPDDFAWLVQSEGGTHVLLPLKKAVGRDGAPLAVVGWQPVPPSQKRFPTFRMAVRDRQGNIVYWWLWDGAMIWHQKELSSDQQQLPFRAVLSLDELIKQVQEGGLSPSS